MSPLFLIRTAARQAWQKLDNFAWVTAALLLAVGSFAARAHTPLSALLAAAALAAVVLGALRERRSRRAAQAPEFDASSVTNEAFPAIGLDEHGRPLDS